MSLHLITGHSGKAHITAADQGALNACQFGAEDYVLKSGEQFAASVITNNQIRIADGEVMMQGRHIRLARGTYEDVTIENGSQGMNRNDLIVIRYTKNADSGIEEAALVVIKGEETTGTASDPEHTTGNILAGDCTLHEMPLYRVPLTGITVGELVPLFDRAYSTTQTALLWENASPTSNFAAQAIKLNLADYDFVEVVCLAGKSLDNSTYTEKTVIGMKGVHRTDINTNNTATTGIALRNYTTDVNGITFNDVTYKSGATGSPSTNNNYLTPYRIYGIKGVQ